MMHMPLQGGSTGPGINHDLHSVVKVFCTENYSYMLNVCHPKPDRDMLPCTEWTMWNCYTVQIDNLVLVYSDCEGAWPGSWTKIGHTWCRLSGRIAEAEEHAGQG